MEDSMNKIILKYNTPKNVIREKTVIPQERITIEKRILKKINNFNRNEEPEVVKGLFSLAKTSIKYPNINNGIGMIMSAGGRNHIKESYLAVRSLRYFGFPYPIQLWYLGDNEKPTEKEEKIFSEQDVEFINSHEVAIKTGYSLKNLRAWENKCFSIVRSKFKEVFFMDTDNLALQNISNLLICKLYKKEKAIMWKDIQLNTGDFGSINKKAWDSIGVNLPRQEIESGQLLFNKEYCWKELNLALYMNDHSDFFYSNWTYGDKDTFSLSFIINRGCVPIMKHIPKYTNQDGIFIQMDEDDKPLFQHRRKLESYKKQNNKYYLDSLCHEWFLKYDEVVE